MTKQEFRKFREYYFPEETIIKSRELMSKEFGITTRCIKSWEIGQSPVQLWFDKFSESFDKDNILKDK